jgi:transposase
MADNLRVMTERVDDIPVLLAQAEKIGVAELLDQHFAPHGNWQGCSLGWTATVWLTHILSEGDHRLNQVEGWVADRLHTLGMSTGQAVRAGEWSDDRLGIVLDELSDPERWQAFERDLNRRSLRVYRLKPSQVRVDSTTASGYWSVTEDGLFQFGHSKDHRPDLPQLKVMLSALDPLGLPLVSQVVSGESADDRLYIPAIQQVRGSLDELGLLYIGDCKLAAVGTRAFIQAGSDYYLCPLSEKQMPKAALEAYLKPVWAGAQATQPIERLQADGGLETIAEGYERDVALTWAGDGPAQHWRERHLIVRSLQHARAAEAALRARLTKAQSELEQLTVPRQGKRGLTEPAALQAAAEAIVQRYRVKDLLKLTVRVHNTERPVRAYSDRPARTEIDQILNLQVEIDTAAVQAAERWLGWRVYATNHSPEILPLEKALLAYREEYLVEHSFGRLKGKPLSLTPMYLQSDTRATGLIRLLSIGLRWLTLLEYQVRQRLREQPAKLAGLYAGNPKRTTERPTAEALLTAFKGIHFSVVTLGEQCLAHLTPLLDKQKTILTLLDFPITIYTRLVSGFPQTALKLTEP